MSPSGEPRIETIRLDLACPKCEYNLRRQSVEVVTCPECGTRFDTERLFRNQWRVPWWRGPDSRFLAYPALWLLFWAFVLVIACPMAEFYGWSTFARVLLLVAGATLALSVWLVQLLYVRRHWGSFEGLRLALLVHAIYPVYTLGAMCCVTVCEFLIALVVSAFVPNLFKYTIIGLIYLPVGIVLFVVAYRMERYVTKQCRRRYLMNYASLEADQSPHLSIQPTIREAANALSCMAQESPPIAPDKANED